MMQLNQRLQNTIKCLLAKKHTSRELMGKIPANNPPDYIKMLRHNFGLIIYKEKVRNKSYYLFWIPECDRYKAEKLLKGAATPNNKINKCKQEQTIEEAILSQ